MGQTPNRAPLRRHRTTVFALLATIAALGSVQALSAAPAAAATDENNDCASLPNIWEQLSCEEDHGGSGTSDAGTSNSTTADSETTEADSGTESTQSQKKSYGPPLTYTDDFFDDVFTEDGMKKLRRSLMECDRVWRATRRVTQIHPYRFSSWVEHDPNDAEVNRELRESWHKHDCGLVYDLLAHP